MTFAIIIRCQLAYGLSLQLRGLRIRAITNVISGATRVMGGIVPMFFFQHGMVAIISRYSYSMYKEQEYPYLNYHVYLLKVVQYSGLNFSCQVIS